jgi:hypothetical protein
MSPGLFGSEKCPGVDHKLQSPCPWTLCMCWSLSWHAMPSPMAPASCFTELLEPTTVHPTVPWQPAL